MKDGLVQKLYTTKSGESTQIYKSKSTSDAKWFTSESFRI